MKKILTVLLFVAAAFVGLQAENIQVRGTVVSATDGEPLIGASVVPTGTSNGVSTDIDGNYSIAIDAQGSLTFSYVGYESQTVKVNGRNEINVRLQDSSNVLEEMVVVGYGVQKKSVVTASIAKVTSDDLANTAPVRMDNALKGLASGVNVTSNSGQPGEGARVRIRGTGTINNSDPLYIVDGMPIGGGLDFVNPNDIESIEVLKDAASGAIYGARAANGVILVTTKKGKQGNARVNYHFSYGWQSAAKKRSVTNATDYAILQNEYRVNGGQAPIYADPYNLVDINGDKVVGDGTDWQDLVFNDNAPVMNHDVSISGASERMNYYLSLGYYTQEGIVGGNYGHSNYDRLTLRSNNTYIAFDETKNRNFLNKLEIGANVAYMRTHSTGISTNSEYGSVLGSALYMSPLLPVTVHGETAEAMRKTYSDYTLYTDANGNPYTIAGYGGTYQEMNNPLAILSQNPTKNWSHKFVGAFNAEITIWDTLKYRFSYDADMAFWGYDSATLENYYLSGNNNASHTEAGKANYKSTTWQIENLISWNKSFADKHNFSVVLGQSAMKYKGDYLGGSRWGLVNTDKPSIDYTNSTIIYETDSDGNITGATVPYSVWGGNYTEHHMSSLFARVSYDYDSKYMIQATVRRDGSSRFGSNNKYGTFPSVSAGWNIMNEHFMESTREWLNNWKLRASWGKNGNDNIGDFGYTSLTAMGNNVLFGKTATKYNGSKASRVANPGLKWEESEQFDIGMDFAFLNNRVTLTVDYYEKKTNGMIIEMPIPSYVGETKPLGNVGDMKNSGWEFDASYRWNIADAMFQIKGNATYLKNKLTNLGNSDGFLNLDSAQGLTGTITRAENGQPSPFFYGYKTDGIFQNYDEINAYTNASGSLIQPDAVPGDVRFVDVNGDGLIDDNDRTNIGNGTPDWEFGLSLNANWKGFDFNIFFQGVHGADVFDATYRTDVYSGNYPSWMLGRWTGEGTSNKYPRIAAGNTTNWVVSDLYVYDGSYWRLKNIMLGYTLPENLTRRVSIQSLRFYVSAENLKTWTKYHGYDPEIASGGTSLGIDRGVYPQARVWTIGAQISF